jgi:hypothetical protein
MEQTPKGILEKLRHAPDAASWKRLVDLYTPLIQTWLRQQGIPAADTARRTETHKGRRPKFKRCVPFRP